MIIPYNNTFHQFLIGLNSDDHLQYVHVSTPRVITTAHHFSGLIPFNVYSTGKIDNLNASYLNGFTSDQFASNIHTHSTGNINGLSSFILELGDSHYSSIGHSHTPNEIIGLINFITDTTDTRYSATGHIHNTGQITNLSQYITQISATGIGSHTHATGEIVNLSPYITSLAKSSVSGTTPIAISNGHVTLVDNYFSPTGHKHNASDIISGTFDDLRISSSNVTQHQSLLTINYSQLSSIPTGFIPLSHIHNTGQIANLSQYILQISATGIGSHTHTTGEIINLSQYITQIAATGIGNHVHTTGEVTNLSSYVNLLAKDAISGTLPISVTNGNVTLNQGLLDHGSIGGLGDDDHVQYHNDNRALTWLNSRSTSDLPEGTNEYFTNEKVDDRVSNLISNGTGLIWVYDDSANKLIGNIALNDTILPTGINANKIGLGLVTNTQFGYLSTVTSNVQDQLDTKLSSNQLITVTGHILGTGNTLINTTLAPINGLSAGTYIAATITVDDYGRVTYAEQKALAVYKMLEMLSVMP